LLAVSFLCTVFGLTLIPQPSPRLSLYNAIFIPMFDQYLRLEQSQDFKFFYHLLCRLYMLRMWHNALNRAYIYTGLALIKADTFRTTVHINLIDFRTLINRIIWTFC